MSNSLKDVFFCFPKDDSLNYENFKKNFYTSYFKEKDKYFLSSKYDETKKKLKPLP